jgi:hypothetical protein
LPFGAVCLPAWDIGPPYFARFAGVSGTGPLVVVVLVTEAPEDGSVAVTEVETAAPVWAAGGAAVSVEVVVVVVCWAYAAPPIKAVAATAVSRLAIFMTWSPVAFVDN